MKENYPASEVHDDDDDDEGGKQQPGGLPSVLGQETAPVLSF